MHFGAPQLLSTLLFCLLPLLIYLLFRRRHRKQDFGAMVILLRAYARLRRRIRVKEMILLSLRTFALLAFFLALAHPLLTGAGTDRPNMYFVFLDGSLSMRTAVRGKTRFDAARDYLRAKADSASPGDFFKLTVFDDTIQPSSRALSPTQFKEQLSRIEPSFRGTSPQLILPMLRQEWGLADKSGCVGHFVLVSDFAQNAYDRPEAFFSKLASEIWANAPITIVTCSAQDDKNAAVEDLEPARSVFATGLGTVLKAHLNLWGGEGERESQVTFKRLDEAIATRSTRVKEGGSSVAFPEKPAEEGSVCYSVSMTPDSLPDDDIRFFAADVSRKVNVLLVDGRPSAGSFQAASSYLAAALAPFDNSEFSTISVSTTAISDFEGMESYPADVIVILEPPAISPASAERIKAFVSLGGGLLIVCGPAMRPAALNEQLGGDAGVLPAEMTAIQESQGNGYASLTDLKMPETLEGLAGLWRSGMKRLKIFSYFDARPRSDATTLAKLDNGRPLLIERARGRGKTLLWTSTFDGQWTNLVALPMFPPLANELCYYLAGKSSQETNVTVGAKVSIPLTITEAAGSCTLTLPDSTAVELLPRVAEGKALLDYGPVEIPGRYKFTAPGGRTTYVAVNTPREESDITPLPPAALRKVWNLPNVRIEDARKPYTTPATMEGKFSDIQMVLLFAALVFLALEALLASTFSAPFQVRASQAGR
ncbi:MAG: BatA domain-containing protein [Candidatus Brocadiia bacterium]